MSKRPSRLLTMKQAAQELGVDYFTISRWINAEEKSQRLGCIRRGKRFVRISKHHIASFLSRMDTVNRHPMKRGKNKLEAIAL